MVHRFGNRLTNTINSTTSNYTYQKLGANPNDWQRLTSDGTSSYTYDSNGSTLTRGSNRFGWDYDNRMSSISGSVSASYGYDCFGRRSSKSVSSTTTSYIYDGLNLIAETTGGLTTNHLFGPRVDEPLASSNGSSVVYHSIDELGSVTLASDPSGSPQNTYEV